MFRADLLLEIIKESKIVDNTVLYTDYGTNDLNVEECIPAFVKSILS